MLATDDETGRTKPYQIIAPIPGAPRPAAPMVGKDDPRYYDLTWFAAAERGQTWVEARYEQIAAIQARKADKRRRAPPSRLIAIHAPSSGLQQVFSDLIPAKPYCANHVNDGLRIRPKSSALRHRHIQMNGPASFRWMLHDIDRRDAYCAHDDANIPQPNAIMINPENGHAHSAILLASPVARHCASRLGPLRFFGAVERGIARRLNADRRYTGLIAKNPLHADWRVEWRREQPYTLSELARWLDDNDMAPDPSVQTTFGGGRNVTIFDELRGFAYREVLKFKSGDDGAAGLAAFRTRLEAVALGINKQFPRSLALGEVRAIAKSVAKWTWSRFTSEKFSHLQRHRAQANTRRHSVVVRDMKMAAPYPTRRPVTAQVLADRLQTTPRTARRAWSESRTTFEARSLSRQRPWEADGVSRATWYRRKRRAEQSTP